MKTKIVVLVGIALCTMLLISPALASASENVLGIYGNANEDDTIDMRDLTYVKLIFFGKKPETELADAKYDGKINPLDFIQIKLIIVGKEKELTIIDSADRIVTVKKPVERIVAFHHSTIAAMRSIKAADKIVGVGYGSGMKWLYPEFKDFPNVGYVTNPDYEEILNCDLDVLFLFATTGHKSRCEVVRDKLNELDPTIAVIGFDFLGAETYVDEIRKLGYITDKENEACEFIDFYNEWMDKIKERIEGLSEGDITKVYFEEFYPLSYNTYGTGMVLHDCLVAAGGINIFDRAGFVFEVDPEEVIDRNPDVILKYAAGTRYARSSADNFAYDTAKMNELREEILNRPELQKVAAVKDERVYIITNEVLIGGWHLVGISYMAKWFHPELFSDIDPKAIHQEYITRFQEGFDYDLNEPGAFVYPES